MVAVSTWCLMFRAISFCILFYSAVSTEAAEIGVIQKDADTAVINVSGQLEPGDDRKFAQAALQYENAVVALNSPGGRMLVGIELGKAIRLKGFSTLVDEDALCASACGYAWLGGVRRGMSTGSRIGFHAAYVQENGQNRETGLGNALVGAYLNQLGLSQTAVAYVAAAPPDGMTWLTPEDAARVGIEVAVVNRRGHEAQESPTVTTIKRIENSDILGHDFKRMPINGLTLEECERECSTNSDCKAFTFNARHSACFLKSDGARAYTSAGAQSGYKTELEGRIRRSTLTIAEQTDLPGSDYRALNRSELSLCADVCESDGKCVAFTYVPNIRRCWLKSSVPASTISRNTVSGFKITH
jgi:hypothetical protein